MKLEKERGLWKEDDWGRGWATDAADAGVAGGGGGAAAEPAGIRAAAGTVTAATAAVAESGMSRHQRARVPDWAANGGGNRWPP